MKQNAFYPFHLSTTRFINEWWVDWMRMRWWAGDGWVGWSGWIRVKVHLLQIRPVARPTLKFTSSVATSPLLHHHIPSPSSPSSIIHAVPTQHQQRPSSSSYAIFTEFQPPPLLIDLPVHNHHHHRGPLQPRNRTAQSCRTVEAAPTKEEKQQRIG